VPDLPDFPVDDATLDLLWDAMHPGPEAERSSVGDVLDLYTRLGGSDPDAIDYEGTSEVNDPAMTVMRDPQYHPNDVLSALIIEVRRLRTERADEQGPAPADPPDNDGSIEGGD
jgi:hypothetical protein